VKVSKKEKIRTRRRIIKAAVELMGEKGYNKVNMRTIARAAGIGDATIYKYFSSKEKLLTGYYELCVEDTAEALRKIDDIDQYELHEKLQLLLDTWLGHMLPNREFVCESFPLLYQSPMFLFSHVNPIHQELMPVIAQFLDDARGKEDIPAFPFQSVLPDVLCEYMIGILYFWTRDESEEFHETTQLIDVSLNFVITLLKSGIINHTADFLGFMLKSQMFRILSPGNGLLQSLLNANNMGRQ